MSQGYLWMLIICGTIQAVLLALVIVSLWRYRAARAWSQTTGTVTTSRVESHRKSSSSLADAHAAVTNSPLVIYQYQVNHQSFSGSRVTIGDMTSNRELERILDRYPVGAKVVVYYNPADPQQAVLERDFPVRFCWGIAIGQLLPFGLPLAAIEIYRYCGDWLTAAVVASPFAAGFGSLGLVVLAYAIILAGLAVRASAWPTTRGRVVSASVDEYSDGEESVFKASVTYTYEVNGRHYLSGGVTISIGVFASNNSWLSRKTLARYPVGTKVNVHYNPKQPAESVLHVWSAGQIVPWLIAAALLALAWWMAVLE